MAFSFFSVCVVVWLLSLSSAHANDETPSLYLYAPGSALDSELAAHEPPPPTLLKRAWYAISLDGSTLVLDRSVTTRATDWQFTQRSTSRQTHASTLKLNPLAPSRHALAMPEAAFLAFRFDEKIAFKAGRYASVLPVPALLHDRWNAAFGANGKQWTVSTESVRRKDGGLLAGSLQLVATSNTGEKRVLVPPAHGMAFQRQELLWLGALQSNSQWDVLLKRTWITGEMDYVLTIGKSVKSQTIDLDYPHTYFSSGVEEYEEIATHRSQKRARPEGKFGAVGFSISEERWNQAVSEAASQMLPKVLFDRQLMVGTEKMRVTIEYLPRLAYPSESSTPPVMSSSAEGFFWGGPVVVKAHFRGKSQALMQTGQLDGSAFHIELDGLEAEPGVRVSFSPHYNNSLVYYWIWGDPEGRFLRLSKEHGQGC